MLKTILRFIVSMSLCPVLVGAAQNPIAPVTVDSGPAQEVIWQGKDLVNGHGLEMIPVPISTPGFDNAPYLTSAKRESFPQIRLNPRGRSVNTRGTSVTEVCLRIWK